MCFFAERGDFFVPRIVSRETYLPKEDFPSNVKKSAGAARRDRIEKHTKLLGNLNYNINAVFVFVLLNLHVKPAFAQLVAGGVHGVYE